MLEVQVKEEYAAILEPLQENVDAALRQYSIEKAKTRVLELEQLLQKQEE